MKLLEFAAGEKVRRCRLCAIPERKEIEDAVSKGVAWTTIARWLVSKKGYELGDVSVWRLRYCFDQHRQAPVRKSKGAA